MKKRIKVLEAHTIDEVEDLANLELKFLESKESGINATITDITIIPSSGRYLIQITYLSEYPD